MLHTPTTYSIYKESLNLCWVNLNSNTKFVMVMRSSSHSQFDICETLSINWLCLGTKHQWYKHRVHLTLSCSLLAWNRVCQSSATARSMMLWWRQVSVKMLWWRQVSVRCSWWTKVRCSAIFWWRKVSVKIFCDVVVELCLCKDQAIAKSSLKSKMD